MLVVALALHFAELRAAGVRILREEVHDVGVVPAAARLGLLGGEHVARVRRDDVRCLEGAHKASVEADELELVAHLAVNGVQRAVYLTQRETVRIVHLIEAHAAYAAAAVVPEHQTHVLRWVILNSPGNEIRKGLRVAHVLKVELIYKLKLAVVCDVALRYAVRNAVVLVPLGGSAGLVNDTDVVAVCTEQGFLDIH